MCRVNLIVIITLFGSYCFGQSVSVQQNQNNVNINLPVIEKTVYVDRYRTVYVDRPQPKRVAKKLTAPIQLLGYLWVYPEDLGNFKQQPLDIIKNINAQIPHGRDNWRIPTADELAVLEANADKVGLGDDIYLATDHSNGVLRLVSTGQLKVELEKYSVTVNGVTWAISNVGTDKPSEYGALFTWETAQNSCPSGWRVPSEQDFEDLKNASKGGVWGTLDGIQGMWFSGNGQADATGVFLPAAGDRIKGEPISNRNNASKIGMYWYNKKPFIRESARSYTYYTTYFYFFFFDETQSKISSNNTAEMYLPSEDMFYFSCRCVK
jgi:uncharacterized protein (TIGR02145 family)